MYHNLRTRYRSAHAQSTEMWPSTTAEKRVTPRRPHAKTKALLSVISSADQTQRSTELTKNIACHPMIAVSSRGLPNVLSAGWPRIYCSPATLWARNAHRAVRLTNKIPRTCKTSMPNFSPFPHSVKITAASSSSRPRVYSTQGPLQSHYVTCKSYPCMLLKSESKLMKCKAARFQKGFLPQRSRYLRQE